MKRLLLLLVGACGQAATTPPPTPPPPPASSSSPSSPPNSPAPPPSPSSEAPWEVAAKAIAFASGIHRCGDDDCEVGKEACCEGSAPQGIRASECVPTVAFDWMKQSGPCGQAVPRLDAIHHCDDDGDCRSGFVCCSDFVGEAEGVSLCKPSAEDGSSPCTDHQRCAVDGQRCRQPNTTCGDGRCRLAGAEVACGDQRCSGARPLCCDDGAAPRCVAYGGCKGFDEGETIVECDGGEDCLPGQVCCAYAAGDTLCTGFCPGAHATAQP